MSRIYKKEINKWDLTYGSMMSLVQKLVTIDSSDINLNGHYIVHGTTISNISDISVGHSDKMLSTAPTKIPAIDTNIQILSLHRSHLIPCDITFLFITNEEVSLSNTRAWESNS